MADDDDDSEYYSEGFELDEATVAALDAQERKYFPPARDCPIDEDKDEPAKKRRRLDYEEDDEGILVDNWETTVESLELPDLTWAKPATRRAAPSHSVTRPGPVAPRRPITPPAAIPAAEAHLLASSPPALSLPAADAVEELRLRLEEVIFLNSRKTTRLNNVLTDPRRE